MALLDFCSYEDVRAILGVTDDEIEDATLALPLYLKQLQFALEDIAVGLEPLYLTLNAQPTRTAVESKLVDVLQVFSAYCISKNLLTAIPLFSPKRIQDGRAVIERFPDPFSDLREGVDMAYISLLARLTGLLPGVGLLPLGSTVSRTYFSTSLLANDPVTQ